MEQIDKDADSPRSFRAATAFVSLMIFLQWCVLDFYTVRMIPYPEQVHDNEWMILIFPVLPSIILFAWSKRSRSLLTPGVIVGAILLGIVLSIPLIGFFGVNFHLSIGGQL
ncbi:hypothetical protein [Gimesia sp.]|uniref:hypothetical protein n=1 Tax=Gimesia sp. TaxID=2024833 RepID=UPI000C54894B|nr:hypothetical protein [Gimesia sp.]MAX38597.1 hypothetical protein [Gimesia sp.]HAH47731.1 hypothetical protein [Planctomycetaceae bacterium]HBL47841.1 hypothetical protein [Planctomycetaceae bacterium]|tara:strand:- start:1496 stop:1828 length:333 start_codon:yes stop_codon:yes gene_type:complete